MLTDLKARPYLHTRFPSNGSFVPLPLQFIPVEEHQVAVLNDGKLSLCVRQVVLAG
jgi:hypothetical protein